MAAAIAALALVFAVRSSNANRRSAAAAQRTIARLLEDDASLQATRFGMSLQDVELPITYRHYREPTLLDKLMGRDDYVCLTIGLANKSNENLRDVIVYLVQRRKYYMVGRFDLLPPSNGEVLYVADCVPCPPTHSNSYNLEACFRDSKGRCFRSDGLRVDPLTSDEWVELVINRVFRQDRRRTMSMKTLMKRIPIDLLHKHDPKPIAPVGEAPKAAAPAAPPAPKPPAPPAPKTASEKPTPDTAAPPVPKAATKDSDAPDPSNGSPDGH
jgi:hypothetical protein